MGKADLDDVSAAFIKVAESYSELRDLAAQSARGQTA
jgi:hypothetical protein